MEYIVVIGLFLIVFIHEERKKKRDPGYRSWMDEGSHWDHWNHRKHGKD